MSARIYVSDDMLSAYLDNELPAPQSTAVEQALQQNPALALRLQALQQSDAMFKNLAHDMDNRPLPQGLRTLQQEDVAATLLAALRRSTALIRSPWALMATTAMLVILALPLLSPGTPQSAHLAITAYSAMLDTLPSGQSASVTDQAELMQRFSFQAVDGRYCRQFRLLTDLRLEENIACHDAGQWTLEASFITAAPPAEAPFRPASASSPLDQVLEQLMPGGALPLQQEALLISRGWQRAAH